MTIELRDILQVVSTLIAATSVFYAVRTFKRARLTQQIGALRDALGESLRNMNDLDNLLSERVTNSLGVAISGELRRIIGDDVELNELVAVIGNEANHNLIVQAIYAGFDKSNIQVNIDNGRHYFDSLQIKLKPLAPNTAAVVSTIGEYVISLVFSAFATGHVKQVFTHEANRKMLAEGLLAKGTTRLAYAEIGNDFAEPSSYFIRTYADKQFSRVRVIHDIIVNSLMEKSDDELIEFFHKEKTVVLAPRGEGIPDLLSLLSSITHEYGRLFSPADRDKLTKASTQIEENQVKDKLPG